MKLTDAMLRNLKDPGKHFDGYGLYLEITKAGGRYWRMKYRHGGKEKRLALGVYPDTTLKQAREKAGEARKSLAEGLDPSEIKQQAKAKVKHETATTFKAVANEWLKHQSGRWEPATRERIRAALELHIFPELGGKPMATITPLDLKRSVTKIEANGAGFMAGRVLQRVKSVYRWALVHQRIESNPMIDLLPSEILKPREVKHRPALADAELPTFLKKLDAYGGDPHTLAALRLLVLTATRPGEVRGAAWAEFDLEQALWVIPAERMKMRVEHRVPLSRQALEVLEAIKPLTGGGALVFPSPFYPSKPLSENTFNSAMARMGYKYQATAHGFRALFSTVANESGWNPDVIERQLAHLERNQVRAAYHRSTYLKDRAQLMQWWADYLDGRKAGNVVKFTKSRAA
jgi:integrase